MKRLFESPTQKKRKVKLQKQLDRLGIEDADEKRRAFQVCLLRGISTAQYAVLLQKQKQEHGDRCPICLAKDVKFHLDHDHETGKVRMFICSRCNAALGMCYDDPDRLIAMVRYLEKFGKKRSKLYLIP